MSFTIETYEENVYSRLEESIFEYMDDEMTDKLIPHLKKALYKELATRRDAVFRVESIVRTLFPGEEHETTN